MVYKIGNAAGFLGRIKTYRTGATLRTKLPHHAF